MVDGLLGAHADAVVADGQGPGLFVKADAYAQVRRVTLSLEPWTIDNGLLTPTLKLKRAKVMEKFNEELDRMYASLA